MYFGNGALTWDNISNPPTIPTSYNQLSNIKPLTYIDSSGIYTGTIQANQINTTGLTAERIQTKYNTYYGDITVAELYKDDKGGRLKLYDTDGFFNAVIGSESGDGDNVGGTLLLLGDCPYDTTTPYDGTNGYIPWIRASMGILEDPTNDSTGKEAGILLLNGSDPTNGHSISRVMLQASSDLGDYAVLRLKDETGIIRATLKAGGNYQLDLTGNARILGTLYGKIDQLDSRRIFFRTTDPASTDTVNEGDFWFDVNAHSIRYRNSNMWAVFK